MTNVGNCVKQAQKLKGIKSADLARASGVRPQQVMRWRSQENMKLHTIELLCEIFGISIDEFCSLDR